MLPEIVISIICKASDRWVQIAHDGTGWVLCVFLWSKNIAWLGPPFQMSWSLGGMSWSRGGSVMAGGDPCQAFTCDLLHSVLAFTRSSGLGCDGWTRMEGRPGFSSQI